MTTAHVEKFAELVAKDPALLAKLGLDKVNADAATASASAAAFITNAVKEAKAHGLEFTEAELHAYMAAERKVLASGEMSDTQLDAGGISGGKTPQSYVLKYAIDGMANKQEIAALETGKSFGQMERLTGVRWTTDEKYKDLP